MMTIIQVTALFFLWQVVVSMRAEKKATEDHYAAQLATSVFLSEDHFTWETCRNDTRPETVAALRVVDAYAEEMTFYQGRRTRNCFIAIALSLLLMSWGLLVSRGRTFTRRVTQS